VAAAATRQLAQSAAGPPGKATAAAEAPSSSLSLPLPPSTARCSAAARCSADARFDRGKEARKAHM